MVPNHADLDRVFISVCEVLKPIASNLNIDANIGAPSSSQMNLGVLLSAEIKNLGNVASFASLGVLE